MGETAAASPLARPMMLVIARSYDLCVPHDRASPHLWEEARPDAQVRVQTWGNTSSAWEVALRCHRDSPRLMTAGDWAGGHVANGGVIRDVWSRRRCLA